MDNFLTLESLEQRDIIKGECVLYIQGSTKDETISDEALHDEIKTHLETGELRTKELAKKISKQYGLPTKKVYDLILNIQDDNHS